MRNPLAVGFLAASLLQETAPAPPPQQTDQSAPAVVEASRDNQDKKQLTVPAGTRLQVALSSPIRTKIARRGDTVRAVTAFPVASNGQVAIPAGTYLEGVLEKILKRGPSGGPGLQMHFTRMVFASGYTVSIQKAIAVADNVPADSAPASQGIGPSDSSLVEAFGQIPQSPPTLTPPPMPGPHTGTVVGIGVGLAAAGIIGGILWSRHQRGDVVFDVGSPFEVVLDSPVSLEIDRVSLTAARGVAQ